MKKILLTIVVTLLSVVSFAQIDLTDEVEISVGNPINRSEWSATGHRPFISSNSIINVRKKPAKQFLIFSFGGKNKYYAFERISLETQKVIQRNEIKANFDHANLSFIQLEDKYICYYSVYDKKDNKTTLFYREIDTKTLTIGSKEKRLVSYFGKITGNTFGLKLSRDKSKILITYRVVPNQKSDKKSKDIIGMHVFSSKLEKLYGGDYTMPYTESEMDNKDYGIDNEGNIYILTLVYHDKTAKQYKPNGSINYHIELMKYQKGKSPIIFPIKMKNKYMDQIRFSEGQDNELIIAGTYSNDKEPGFSGFFYSRLDQESLENLKFVEIPKDIIKKYERKAVKKKVDKNDAKGRELKLTNYYIKRTYIDEDGTFSIYAEEFIVDVWTDRNNVAHYYYHYNDILTMGISRDGEVIWVDKIPKAQVNQTHFALGMRTFKNDKYDFILYNDRKENMNVTADDQLAIFVGNQGQLNAIRINRKTGEMHRMFLWEIGDLEGLTVGSFNLGTINSLGSDDFLVQLNIISKAKVKQDVIVRVKFMN